MADPQLPSNFVQSSAPSPPPLPPSRAPLINGRIGSATRQSETSLFIRKLMDGHQGDRIKPANPNMGTEARNAPRTGPYFFYGSLADPSMLADVLDLDETPEFRPASIAGFSVKLWGQYPALVDGDNVAVVGQVYIVRTEAHAMRLAKYETGAYVAVPCLIQYRDGKEPAVVRGTTFKYAGNPLDLDEGTFDLDRWLVSIGRKGERDG